MKPETYDRVKKSTEKGAISFIDALIKKGIPLSSINVNDWGASPNTIVYLTIPYGSNKNSGKFKSWKNRFGSATVKSALKFWKTKD